MPRPLSLVVAVLVVAAVAGCAGAAQPALEVGDRSYSRAELLDAVAAELDAGDDLPLAVGRDSFNSAANAVLLAEVNETIATELDRRGVESSDQDLAAFGLPEDFDPDSLGPAERAAFDLQLALVTLDRVLTEEGGSIDLYLEELFSSVRLDPRFGVFDPQFGVSSPPRSGDVAVEVPAPVEGDGS